MSEQSDTARKLQVAAYGLLAGGFVLSAIATWKSGNGNGGRTPAAASELRGLGKAASQRSLPAPKTKNYDVGDIDERVSLIGDLIRKGSLNSALREKTVEILSTKCDALGRIQPKGKGGKYCVPEKDCLAEVQAIFDAIRNPKSKFSVRYTRDSILADVFTAPERTLLKTHGGDCDDFCVTIGAMLMAVGHPVRLRVIQTSDKPSWSHIYLITPTKFDDPRAPWISVDASMDKPLGWEAPGAREVAKTGKPHGIVTRVRDYQVVKPSEIA